MNYIKQEKLSILLKINCVLTILFSIWALTPYLNRNINKIIPVCITIAWIITALIQIFMKKKKILYMPVILVIVVWQLWEYSLKIKGYSTLSIGNYLLNTLFWFSMIIYIFYQSYVSDDTKKKIFMSIFIIYIINLIDNIRLSLIYPDVSSIINFPWGTEYLNMNVGKTSFVAVVLFMFCISLSLALNETNKTKKVILVIISILQIIYIYLTGRVIALGFVVLTVLICLINKINEKIKINKEKKRLIIIISIVISLIFVRFVLPEILEALINMISSDRMKNRLNDIISLLEGNYSLDVNDTSSMNRRIILYKISIETFFSNIKTFFIGIGAHGFTTYDKAFITGIGGHSEMFDLAAMYGIVGILFVLMIFVKFFKIILKENEKAIYIKNTISIFILYSLFNNTTYPEIGIVVFLILPYTKYILNNKKSNIYNISYKKEGNINGSEKN